MGPITYSRYNSMPDRVVVDVVDVRGVIGFVPDDVLPEPALPDGLLAIGATAGAQV